MTSIRRLRPSPPRLPIALTLALTLLLSVIGCRSGVSPALTATTQGVNGVYAHADVQAVVAPPEGWKPDPLKRSGTHRHQVWLSPSGNTAYGVIRFSLPLPVGHDLALWGFLREMRSSEGEATLVEKRWDAERRVLRFVAEGGLYRVRSVLRVRGFGGWIAYAGTLRNQPINDAELALAELAREQTRFGLPETRKPEQPSSRASD